MKKASFAIFAAVMFVFLISIPLNAAEYKEQPKTPPFEMSHLVTATATVEAVDQANRTVTVQGPERKVTVKVGDQVQNFSQIKPGDLVNLTYYESLSAQVYKKGETPPTSGIQAKQFGERAAPGQMPAGAVGRQFTITETVASIDKDNNIVVLRAPDGSLDAHKVMDPKQNLAKLDVGDTVVITVTQAMAVSVEEAAGSSQK
jgi:hypothetical protein